MEEKRLESRVPTGNFYTHAPTLHSHLLVSTLQLLMWLLLHPSAWSNYINSIDPKLSPNFALAELTAQHWRHPAMQRLLLSIYGIWPLFVGLIVMIILWIVGDTDVSLGMIFGICIGLTSGLISGTVISVAAGLISVAVVGTSMGVGAGTWGVVMYAGEAALELGSGQPELTSVFTFAIGLFAIGVVGSVAAKIATTISIKRGISHSFLQRSGGILAGILISVVAVAIAIGVVQNMALWLTESDTFDLGRDFGRVYGLIGGIALGSIFALSIHWRMERWKSAIFLGLILALCVGLLRSTLYGSVTELGTYARPAMLGALYGVMYSVVIVLPFVLVERTIDSWAGAIAGMLGGGGAIVTLQLITQEIPAETLSEWSILTSSLLCIIVGLSLYLWLPILLYPIFAIWNTLLYRFDSRRAETSHPYLHLHSAFWHENQRLPLANLDDYLVLAATRRVAPDTVDSNPHDSDIAKESTPSTVGERAIDFLSDSHQRWAAQTAQVELDARMLAEGQTAEAIAESHHALAAGELSGPASSLLRTFSRISQDVEAALAQESNYNQRLALIALEDRLDGLLRELTRSGERYAVRFRPIASHWRQVIGAHVRALATEIELRQEIDSPYIIGIPLTAQQEIFVGRVEISKRIEQLLLDRRHPPLLLYGQRRMGKTSLLNNLGRLLPSTIVPFFVDMQGPVSLASNYTGFLYNIARSMIDSARRQRDLALPALPRDELDQDPFTRFDEWLDEVGEVLEDRTALLALDEFEVLDNAIASGRFEEEAVLGMLRHLIQHRPRFKLLLTGSHILDELPHWAGYLVNVQVVHIGYLSEEETCQLVERPTADFTLRYEPDARQRIYELTRGHPALTQLLCYEIVALKNEGLPSTRRLATLRDVEQVVPDALESGSFFFTEMENQVGTRGQTILYYLAKQGEGAIAHHDELAQQAPIDIDQTLALLIRRDLIESVEIEPTDGESTEKDGRGYRFQVELFRRWFAKNR